jgi:hypothetical protein
VTQQPIQNQLFDSIVGDFKRNQEDECSVKRVDRVWLCSLSRTNSDLCLGIARSDGRQGRRGHRIKPKAIRRPLAREDVVQLDKNACPLRQNGCDLCIRWRFLCRQRACRGLSVTNQQSGKSRERNGGDFGARTVRVVKEQRGYRAKGAQKRMGSRKPENLCGFIFRSFSKLHQQRDGRTMSASIKEIPSINGSYRQCAAQTAGQCP